MASSPPGTASAQVRRDEPPTTALRTVPSPSFAGFLRPRRAGRQSALEAVCLSPVIARIDR
jgi:hypothetical protein